MRDDLKKLRPWLESWGAWRRITLITGYPTSSVSCNPDLHAALPSNEPGFMMPKYDERLSPEVNANRMIAREKELREYYHVRRTETKPSRTSIVPNYSPHWQMNFIDREINLLSPVLKNAIKLRYEDQLKSDEISVLIKRTVDAANKQLDRAHVNLNHVPNVVVSREMYDLFIKNSTSAMFS